MTTLKELKTDKKRKRDGVTCVVDTCHAFAKGSHYEVDGEWCGECDCTVSGKITQETVEDINIIRVKYGEPPLEG